MRAAKFGLVLAAFALCVACGPALNHNQAVYVLVDTSGTYTKEVRKAQAVVNYLLGNLEPGDSLAVATVKSRSFTEKDIVAKVSLTRDPIQVNGQKRAFSAKIAEFAQSVQGSKGTAYTDITGGLVQAAEFLNETGAGSKTIIIFSDMQEELDKITQRDFPMNLKNIRVIAVNVVKLKTDNIDPRLYFGRLEAWQKRVKGAGASEWRVINDLERLDAIFTKG